MEEKTYCFYCEIEVDANTEFCTKCGSVFIDNVLCTNHTEAEAEGVCVVCQHAFCNECGGFVNDVFLCDGHSEYEIYEGMARVFGSSDEAEVNFIKSCLETEGLHPFIYQRKTTPLHLGGVDYSLFRASGDVNGHLVNEIKLMMPCYEVLQAEKIIEDIDQSTIE